MKRVSLSLAVVLRRIARGGHIGKSSGTGLSPDQENSLGARQGAANISTTSPWIPLHGGSTFRMCGGQNT